MMKRIMWRKRAIRPAMAGYLAGLATAGIVAMLMPAAVPEAETGAQSSSPAPSQPAPAPAAASTPPVSPVGVVPEGDKMGGPPSISQHSAAPLSAEARARIAPLEARLADDPADLLTRKRLAVVLLQNQQLMPAYEHASQILQAHPDDPDGLYVHGVVRLAMGHAPVAIELLDRVLERYPDHALALQARAEAQRKIGDEGGAALTEARARQAARSSVPPVPLRGNDSEVEELLAAASDGSLLEMMRGSESAPPVAVEEDAGG